MPACDGSDGASYVMCPSYAEDGRVDLNVARHAVATELGVAAGTVD
jgi:hypothetical protein